MWSTAHCAWASLGKEREGVGGDSDDEGGSGADEVPVRVISRARLVCHSAVQQPAPEQPAAAQPVAMPSPLPRGGAHVSFARRLVSSMSRSPLSPPEPPVLRSATQGP